jgi:hypothetical protein
VAVDKPTISMDAELREQADRLARAEGISFSAFVSNAVNDAVHRRRASKELLAIVADWEGEHGVITDAELRTAASELGLEVPAVKRSKTPKQKVRVTSAAGKSIGRMAATGRLASKSAAKKASPARKR